MIGLLCRTRTGISVKTRMEVKSMYRVLIVDDEPLVRLALRAIIPWHDLGCEVVGEASDGLEAWGRISVQQDIDIMIVDMNMPVIDAIALLSKLQESKLAHSPLSIVLSAYSEFQYVRQAFLLGAVDYITKADLDQEHVIPVIQKVIERLKKESMSFTSSNASADQDRKQREIWLQGLLTDKNFIEHNNLIEEESFQKWVSPYSNFQHIIISLLTDVRVTGTESECKENNEHLVQIIKQRMEMEKHPFECIPIDENECSLLIFFEPSTSYLHLRGRIMEIIDSLCNTVKNFLNVTVSGGVGESCTDWRVWHNRYSHAKKLANLRFSEGPGRVYYPEMLAHIESQPVITWDHTSMMNLIDRGDRQWKKQLQSWISRLNGMPNVSLEASLPLYEELIWNIGALLHAKGLNWTHVMESRRRPYEILEQFNFRDDLHEWMMQLVVRLADLLHPENIQDDNHLRLVDKVKRYLEKNYCNPITLGQVSEWADVTESHLSKQFVKETGEHFTEYLTKLRIQEATRLIETDMKMYDIAIKVGYENPEHFSRVFKKYKGMSPQKYRENHVRKKE